MSKIPPNDIKNDGSSVRVFSIRQATTASFTDLYFNMTCLFFIERGEKHVQTHNQGELLGQEGDLMIFPPGAMVTMQNRPVLEENYQATGISFPQSLVDAVFENERSPNSATDVQLVRAKMHDSKLILNLVNETNADKNLPEVIRKHRLMEVLVWLRDIGIRLPAGAQDHPLSKVRHLIESDLEHEWRVPEVAQHFSMSEATFRRWLSRSGQSFSKILLNTRLEHGLRRLQSTDTRVSEIALECGFKTPSHFTDAFRKRFGVAPKDIRSMSR